MEWTDQELFTRIKSGDRRALEELYERREPGLFRYAFHISGNHAISEEATHEAFLALIQPNVKFDPGRGSLEGYMYGMVRNLVRNMLRNQPAESSHEPVMAGSVLQSLIGDERAAALHRAIRELPEAYRDTVILCDLEEQSYEDAARAMECPVGTVRSRLHRARSLLAAKLKTGSAAAEMAAR